MKISKQTKPKKRERKKPTFLSQKERKGERNLK